MTDTSTPSFYGKYRGIVVSNVDPLMLARLQVQVPAVLGDVTTGWALPCLPFTGDGVGFHVVPEAGAAVWVEFEGGDPSYPIWTGGWYGTGQLPQREKPGVTRPPLKILRSQEGLLIALDDEDRSITLSDSSGANLVTIKTVQGQVHIEAMAKAVVNSPFIELVENATHPVAFGDLLLQYLNQLVMIFNTHLHVGELAAGIIPVTPAPPATPFPPAQPTLISTRVKSG
jgi:hypothetical protein